MEDDVQSASAEGGHIFNDDPFGLQLADEAEILKPQARAGPREGELETLAASSPCETNVLAGEATCDDIDGDAVCIHTFFGQTENGRALCSKRTCKHVSNIVVTRTLKNKIERA